MAAASEKMVLALLFIFFMARGIIIVDANFGKSMYLTWGTQHASIQGEDLQLVLDQTSVLISGSAAQTKIPFLFGSIESKIKLVPNNSAGTVTAYYVSSSLDTQLLILFRFICH
ncbi:hypothetical protein AHAS_Ahas15G0345600 [Arachis hypogaea]